ncbi:MAG: CehA/McbA family metallohydrolase [Bacteroidales bacterium]|nr:CehA/McbA family metallohydrolase [Bacteroidales bacterium]
MGLARLKSGKIQYVSMLLCVLIGISSKAQQSRYYKAQLHCHSTNSDGKFTPTELAAEYRNRGYELLFISDHNIMTPAENITVPGILCFNAEEYTFSKHINGFFLNHTVNADGFTSQQAVDSIRSQGGLSMFNHPVDMTYGPDWSYPENYFDSNSSPDFIEIYNASLASFAPINTEIWDNLLSNNHRIFGIASDDLHSPLRAGLEQLFDRGWIMLKLSSLTKDSVYNALKRGDFYASTGIEISDFLVHENLISISCSNCTEIRFIGENGAILKEVRGSQADFLRLDEKYVRVELEDNGIAGIGRKKAWTNPVFYDDELPENTLVASITEYSTFPNPFFSTMNIAYKLPKADHIRIQLFDYTGTEISELLNEYQQEGAYNLQFDGINLEAGIYYCKLTSTYQSLTNKVILMK